MAEAVDPFAPVNRPGGFGTPDRVVTVHFGASGLVPDVVQSEKGELVLWKVTSGLDDELVVAIRGYPEIGEISIPAAGGAIAFRMRAEKPGTGFPVIDVATGAPLGMFRVEGSHTMDEEAM